MTRSFCALLRVAMVSLLVLLPILQSCFLFPEPEFPLNPVIKFESLEHEGGETEDVVSVTISFEDGDGNLGLNQEDLSGPFAPEVVVDGVVMKNKFNNNFFMTFFIKKAGTFDTLFEFDPAANETRPFSLNGRFPRLNELGADASLKGEISLSDQLILHGSSTTSLRDSVFIGDTLVADIQIVDRDLQLSNVVRSAEFVVGP